MANKFTFELTENEANIVIQALAAQPYQQVAETIHKLQGQAKAQLDAAQTQPTPAPTEGLPVAG